MDVKNEIIASLKAAVRDLVFQGKTLERVESVLQTPKDQGHGDYSSNIALTLFANSRFKIQDLRFKSPMELAEEIAKKLNSSRSTLPNIDKVEAVKPGFINFYLSKKHLVSNLEEILEKKEYGSKPQDLNKKALPVARLPAGQGRQVVVEYSSPNIAKPFTVGHLRSTIIGDAIANLLEANGWKVYRDNHLGDWGTQFGKQIYAIKTWGNEEKIEKSQNPVKELVALYVKLHEEAEKNPELEEKAREWFKKLEEGNSEARRLWKKCVDWSLEEFKTIYEKLGVKFTENDGLGYGESFFEDKIKDILAELEEKKLLTDSEGAKLVFFEHDKLPPFMIIKKDGATLYATRDLATDKFRLGKYPGAKIINEVGVEQTLYFRQLFELEKMLGWVKEGQRIHIKHGHYRFKNEKMSTRRGNTIWLKEVLEEAIRRAENLGSEGKEIAEKVGIGALKWNDLKRSSNLDIVFDWDEILNMQGNSGPYLQYAFARTQSVLAKVKSQKSKVKSTIQNSKVENEEVSLLRSLYRFPEVVGEAAEKFAPNLLCNYLFDLAQKFNLFYQKHKILDSDNQDFRLILTKAAGEVIKKGLNLLGISAPEKM